MAAVETRAKATVSERRYFSGSATIIGLIVVAGFAPNYLLRLLHHNLTLLVNLHGFVMTVWVALFLTQTLLVARHRIDLHRGLGRSGAVLVALVPLIGVPVLVNAAIRQAHGNDVRFCWMLVAFDGVNLVLFAGLAACAIALRRRSDVHKRLMLLATLALLGPAFGRLTAYASGFHGDNDLAVLVLMQAAALACVAIDAVRHRRLHPAFAWAAPLVIAANLLTWMAKMEL